MEKRECWKQVLSLQFPGSGDNQNQWLLASTVLVQNIIFDMDVASAQTSHPTPLPAFVKACQHTALDGEGRKRYSTDRTVNHYPLNKQT